MKVLVTGDLEMIITQLIQESTDLEFWRRHESSDWFQVGDFCGGFDGIEDAFTFSYYHPKKGEYWFQFSIDEAVCASKGLITEFDARPADG